MKDCSASRHELLPTQQAWQQSEPGQDCLTETVKPGLAQFDLSMNGCAQPGVGMSVRGWWFRSSPTPTHRCDPRPVPLRPSGSTAPRSRKVVHDSISRPPETMTSSTTTRRRLRTSPPSASQQVPYLAPSSEIANSAAHLLIWRVASRLPERSCDLIVNGDLAPRVAPDELPGLPFRSGVLSENLRGGGCRWFGPRQMGRKVNWVERLTGCVARVFEL